MKLFVVSQRAVRLGSSMHSGGGWTLNLESPAVGNLLLVNVKSWARKKCKRAPAMNRSER
jgi:hypothetical protein